nr:methyl-accepting chemotaxis protein [uncultured Enterobacter sp.]
MVSVFSRMKVGFRLGAAFAVVVLLLAVVSVTAIMKLTTMNDNIATMLSQNYVKVRLASEVRDGINEQIKFLRGVVIDAKNIEENQQRYAQLAVAVKKTDTLMAKLAAMQTSTVGQQKIRTLLAARDAFADARKQLLALTQSGELYASTEFILRKITIPQNNYLDLTSQLADAQDKQLQAEGAQTIRQGATAIKMAIVVSIIAVIAAIALGYFLTRSIVDPLSKAVRVAENVAAGDLTTEIHITSTDETGMLMHGLRNMNESLLRIVSDVRQGTAAITSASSEIAAGNLDLSSRTEQQASSLEETASAMEQMTATVKQNADNAVQANHLAANASRVAVEGGEVVSQVIVTMEEINSASRKIVDIIAVIDSIAFQTNILALNAAVEAARAGEQGKGFAVVATEVRNLAHRSATAAKEIKGLIEDSVAKVNIGSQLVDKAGSTMSQVVASVKNVTDIIAEISTASKEQSTGILEINSAIVQMDEVTQQNAALVQEASSAAQSLNDQAERLAEAISLFKVSPSFS